jgi:hypothetical protein
MIRRRFRPFIIEVNTTSGKVSERFATYEQARERIERIPADTLVGLPLLFQELPDGSYRVVRDDGKPLQYHRVMDEAISEDEPLPLDESQPLGKPIKFRELPDEE